MSFFIGLIAALSGAVVLYAFVKGWPHSADAIPGLLLGTAIAVGGGLFVVDRMLFLLSPDTVKTVGKVSSVSDGVEGCMATFTYEDRRGRAIEFDFGVHVSPCTWTKGESVTVYYNSENPTQARVDSVWVYLIGPILLLDLVFVIIFGLQLARGAGLAGVAMLGVATAVATVIIVLVLLIRFALR